MEVEGKEAESKMIVIPRGSIKHTIYRPKPLKSHDGLCCLVGGLGTGEDEADEPCNFLRS